MLDNLHELSPAQAHWSLLVCFLYIALAGLLGSLAQLCSLEIQLLHALETALQFPGQFCSTCMTATALSMDDVEHKDLQCWALTIDKWLQITCHQHLVLFLDVSILQLSSPQLWLAMRCRQLEGLQQPLKQLQ